MIKKFSYVVNGEEIAFVVLEEQEKEIHITKTFVKDDFRGQGLAKGLLDDIYFYLKNSKKKTIPMCSYAESYFEKNKEKRDVL
ncbi:MAG: N-acetyltransferase [Anaeroplasmataceae bacterium]|nr:N-acetyltransferase [Anaeroplasmataceae bacterium]